MSDEQSRGDSLVPHPRALATNALMERGNVLADALDAEQARLNAALPQIIDAIRRRQRFVVCSHSRPTGDSIGSQLALSYALRALGKDVRVVNRDPTPQALLAFPGVSGIEIAPHVDGNFDAAILVECGERSRTGLTGLDRFFVINIDHSRHGNTAYGHINWVDATAAACGEMVFELVRTLGVALSLEIATHIYLAILTDTGSFHYSHVSARTFDVCKQTLEAGVDPVLVARNLSPANTVSRLKLFGWVLREMQLDPSGRIAMVHVNREMANTTGGAFEDVEGLVNLPLTVKAIQAVVFFQQLEGDSYRVSLRSRGNVDVGVVAHAFGGGGHRNAASCTVRGPIDGLQSTLVESIRRQDAFQEAAGFVAL